MEVDRDCSSYLSHKLRQSLCLSCCFPSGRRESLEEPYEKPRLIRASSSWLRSRAHELPEFKEKCRNLFCRIGKKRRNNNNSCDFRYDPLSYALNFDEGTEDSRSDEFPLRNFSSRLPASPPPSSTVNPSGKVVSPPAMIAREVTAFS